MSLYLAAYDIHDDWRREQVARVLLRYGERVQRSVFLIWVDPDQVPDLRRALGSRLSTEDRCDLFPVDERGSRKRWSWQRPPVTWAPVILG
jgi:CRISPR-associated endonuclease Cas2